MKKYYLPIDLPRSLEGLMDDADEKIRKAVYERIDKAMAEGLWSEPEDMALDPSNLESAAYWINKTIRPIVKPYRGSGMEAYFEPFKTCEMDWMPEDFLVEKTYRMSASGDLMFAKYLETSKDKIYSAVEPIIFGADLAYANLESTLSVEKPKEFVLEGLGDTPHINITKPQYDALVKHKHHQYDVLQIANNHIMDCGESGARATIEQLEKDKISYLGVYKEEAQAKQVTYTMLDDVKIGWVTHTFGLNGKALPNDKPWMCNVTPFHDETTPDISGIENQIRNAKSEGCDLVIVTLHWGLEFEFYPHPNQKKWAHAFAECGADAIIGHHPHVCQPYEVYRPKTNPKRGVPILYSIGNLTPAFGGAGTVLSLIANIGMAKGKMAGEPCVFVNSINITPVVFVREVVEGECFAALVSLEELVSSEHSSEMEAYLHDVSSYADLVLGNSWRF